MAVQYGLSCTWLETQRTLFSHEAAHYLVDGIMRVINDSNFENIFNIFPYSQLLVLNKMWVLSRINLSLGFLIRSDTNQAVQPQKIQM